MFNNLVFSSFFIWIIINSCSGFQLPFERCKVSPELDGKPNECLAKAMNSAILKLSAGVTELGLIPLDPLKVNEINIDQGGSNPVALKLHFSNCNLIGTSGIKVTELTGKISSPEGFHLKAKMNAPTITLAGPYKASGKVLILPVEGTGESNITIYNAEYHISMKGKKEVKYNEDYLKITDFKLKIVNPKKIKMNFDNLFNGDKVLGDNTNRFLNENWKDIYQEIKVAFEKAFGAVFKAYARATMESTAFNDIFITE